MSRVLGLQTAHMPVWTLPNARDLELQSLITISSLPSEPSLKALCSVSLHWFWEVNSGTSPLPAQSLKLTVTEKENNVMTKSNS